jgi:hypothetical protein
LINFDAKEISFYRNDKSLGVAFKNLKTGPNMAYFPSISLGESQRAVFNFGLRPFSYNINLLNVGVAIHAMNEPDCLIKNYYQTGSYLLQLI